VLLENEASKTSLDIDGDMPVDVICTLAGDTPCTDTTRLALEDLLAE